MKRLDVLKTYKIYIDGQFPRTESGRYYTLNDAKGDMLANICLSSKKDFKNAVVAARNAFSDWSNRSAFNRSQILYRIAEMLESRRTQFLEELTKQGCSKIKANNEIELSIDRIVYYAGWCDKYQQIYSSVNPVASSHFNFSVPEPMGVVSAIAPAESSLLGLVSTLIPIIAGGNTCVVLASESLPLCAVTFAEVLNSSDVPKGVVNILTGKRSELVTPFASHMDVNAIVYCGAIQNEIILIKGEASKNVKRVFVYDVDCYNKEEQSPYYINNLQEIKTTWHPIENIGSGKAGY